MAGFEPKSSGVGSDCSANCATTTALFNHCQSGYFGGQIIWVTSRLARPWITFNWGYLLQIKFRKGSWQQKIELHGAKNGYQLISLITKVIDDLIRDHESLQDWLCRVPLVMPFNSRLHRPVVWCVRVVAAKKRSILREDEDKWGQPDFEFLHFNFVWNCFKKCDLNCCVPILSLFYRGTKTLTFGRIQGKLLTTKKGCNRRLLI